MGFVTQLKWALSKLTVVGRHEFSIFIQVGFAALFDFSPKAYPAYLDRLLAMKCIE